MALDNLLLSHYGVRIAEVVIWNDRFESKRGIKNDHPSPTGSQMQKEYVIPRTIVQAPVELRRARVERLLDIDVCVLHYNGETYLASLPMDRLWRTLMFRLTTL